MAGRGSRQFNGLTVTEVTKAAPMLSVVIPAQNEAGCIENTIRQLHSVMTDEGIPHEFVVVNDHSTDTTAQIVAQLGQELRSVRWVSNETQGGFGYAVRAGLEAFRGDAACIAMADASDDPADVVKYYRLLERGVECVFGTRFARQAVVRGYPHHKLILNRLANWFIQVLFRLNYNDVTNAFKCYRRNVIEGIQPILACHFNITVELPLKAIVRGYSYAVVPVNWYGRRRGLSKFKIKEMGSRYLFIVLYVLLERLLSRGDYHRTTLSTAEAAGARRITE